MPGNFLFYRSFLFLEWKKPRSQELSDMHWHIYAHKYKNFDFGHMYDKICMTKYAWDLALFCTDMRNTLPFTSLIFNFSDCSFSSPNPWVNLVVSSACGVNTSDSGAPSLVFSHS